ncbi:MAG: hypothetical protein A3I32_02540 [Candidatus Yanofskybacteria bacterium RIFCSPLOWO2_02_FULL_45_10]|uniref:Glycosyl transferase family 1 domain-containing protein n=3 Tax=Patescibacteria group TaxID=1783273 RepID=A0A1F8G2G6_9BACT|nr:MAG: Glycosyltransferase [Candidatus Daviesbacteria bacterium GW2011_GWB1_41_5]OGN19537.1 MAG: hypothetical protein A3F25_00335 [Candidatus Yanofskybacteria bacterium RIFCSPHIGHO2_12_FULL_45_19b]OGN32253.1 MAG: hypothetical protein A3I32_02540 [Candidatus Yanofskybacteria bacterium RIFCSPLOWO2_02_FULL_45_10]
MAGILIITQKVDQDEQLLSFFIGWLSVFAQHFERVTVGCLQKGEFSLSSNVSVVSFGKGAGLSKWRQLVNFYKLIIGRQHEYQSVFVHMNPIWVILGGWWWRIKGKKISLWYAHGTVSWKLRLAEKFAHVIFTSTSKGCRIKSNKLQIVGQGIDTDYFKVGSQPDSFSHTPRLVSIGRIAPSKDYETLIVAVKQLVAQGQALSVEIVGGIGVPEDQAYLAKLQALVRDNQLEQIFVFKGALPNKTILPILQSADIFLNMGQTGSLDKAILEAMACGTPVLSCNEALAEVLGVENSHLMYPKKDPQVLAQKIRMILQLTPEERQKLSAKLREVVVSNHNLPNLIKKISTTLAT